MRNMDLPTSDVAGFSQSKLQNGIKSRVMTISVITQINTVLRVQKEKSRGTK